MIITYGRVYINRFTYVSVGVVTAVYIPSIISTGAVVQMLYSCMNTRFSQSLENEQADAGRDGRTRLPTPNLRREHEDREIFMFPVQLDTSRIGNLTGLFHTRLLISESYTFIYEYSSTYRMCVKTHMVLFRRYSYLDRG